MNGMAKLGENAAHWYVNSSLRKYAIAGCSMKPREKAICSAQPRPLRYLGPTSSITAQSSKQAIRQTCTHPSYCPLSSTLKFTILNVIALHKIFHSPLLNTRFSRRYRVDVQNRTERDECRGVINWKTHTLLYFRLLILCYSLPALRRSTKNGTGG